MEYMVHSKTSTGTLITRTTRASIYETLEAVLARSLLSFNTVPAYLMLNTIPLVDNTVHNFRGGMV